MSDRRTSGGDDVESLLEQQRGEIARLEEALSRAEAQRREIERERDRLKRQNERLKDQLDAARRAGFRQAAPFRKARPQGRNGRPGRRAGVAYGRRGRRARPAQRHRATLPSTCPDSGGPVACTRVAAQFQEDLPMVPPIVRQFDVEVGDCLQCGRRVQGAKLPRDGPHRRVQRFGWQAKISEAISEA